MLMLLFKVFCRLAMLLDKKIEVICYSLDADVLYLWRDGKLVTLIDGTVMDDPAPKIDQCKNPPNTDDLDTFT